MLSCQKTVSTIQKKSRAFQIYKNHKNASYINHEKISNMQKISKSTKNYAKSLKITEKYRTSQKWSTNHRKKNSKNHQNHQESPNTWRQSLEPTTRSHIVWIQQSLQKLHHVGIARNNPVPCSDTGLTSPIIFWIRTG